MDFAKLAYLNCISNMITPERLSKMKEVLNDRTRFLTVVVEDIYQSHNASAVLRTCDCFGVQDVHIIENKNRYEVNPDVALGSSKWLDITRYNEPDSDNTRLCIDSLKQSGYLIVATSPHRDDCLLSDLPSDQKLALAFGNEKDGLSETLLRHADVYMRIPMSGFTESLNISVSAAVCLYSLTSRMRSSGVSWQLRDDEKTDILTHWIEQTLSHPGLIRKEFNKRFESGKDT